MKRTSNETKPLLPAAVVDTVVDDDDDTRQESLTKTVRVTQSLAYSAMMIVSLTHDTVMIDSTILPGITIRYLVLPPSPHSVAPKVWAPFNIATLPMSPDYHAVTVFPVMDQPPLSLPHKWGAWNSIGKFPLPRFSDCNEKNGIYHKLLPITRPNLI